MQRFVNYLILLLHSKIFLSISISIVFCFISSLIFLLQVSLTIYIRKTHHCYQFKPRLATNCFYRLVYIVNQIYHRITLFYQLLLWKITWKSYTSTTSCYTFSPSLRSCCVHCWPTHSLLHLFLLLVHHLFFSSSSCKPKNLYINIVDVQYHDRKKIMPKNSYPLKFHYLINNIICNLKHR